MTNTNDERYTIEIETDDYRLTFGAPTCHEVFALYDAVMEE